jgi:hypothetical protein
MIDQYIEANLNDFDLKMNNNDIYLMKKMNERKVWGQRKREKGKTRKKNVKVEECVCVVG